MSAISSLTSTFAISSPDEFLLKVLTEPKSTSAGKLFQTFISLSQKELHIPELYSLSDLLGFCF